MNAVMFESLDTPVRTESLIERASRGDKRAVSLLFDEIAPDIYGQVYLEVRDVEAAERITARSLVWMVAPLQRGEVRTVRELAWRASAYARRETARHLNRRDQLSSVRSAVRHTIGAVFATGLAAYAGLTFI